MKAKTIGRHIKEAFKSIKRNGWMSLAAVSAVAVTLLLVGSFIAVLMNANKLAYDIENDVSVRVYIELAAEEDQKQQLRESIEGIGEVETVEYSSRDAELNQVVGSYGDEFTLFQGDDNPLHDVFIVNTAAPEYTAPVANEIQEMEFVSDVNYGGATADRLFEMMEGARNVGIIVVLALIFTAIFLISNTIRITIFSRRTEIEIMKLVGATNWFIRWPFVIEGALIGFIGALIPVGIISAVYLNGFDRIMNYLADTYFAILPPTPFLWQLSALLAGIGIFIGALGSMLSIRRFLKI